MSSSSALNRYYLRHLEPSLRAEAAFLGEAVRGRQTEGNVAFQERVKTLGLNTGTRVTLIDGKGKVLSDSEKAPNQVVENHLTRPEVKQAQAQPDKFGVTWQRHSTTIDRDMMYVAMRTDDSAGDVAFVRVALPLTAVENHLTELSHLVWTAALITGVAVMGLALWLAWRFAQPFKHLTVAAQQIAKGNYSHKVHEAGRGRSGVAGSDLQHDERATSCSIRPD